MRGRCWRTRPRWRISPPRPMSWFSRRSAHGSRRSPRWRPRPTERTGLSAQPAQTYPAHRSRRDYCVSQGQRDRPTSPLQGGDHATLTVVKARSGEHRWTLDAETTAIIRDLARLLPDAHIASVLNRAGKRTGRDNTWTEPRVRAFRHDHDIPVYRPGERAGRGKLTLIEAANLRGASDTSIGVGRSGRECLSRTADVALICLFATC